MLVLLLLNACASRPDWPAGPQQQNLPESRLLTHVPFHAQERYQCGPAALAMMLNSQSLPHQPQDLVKRVYLPERGGTLQVELVSAAREQGLIVYPLAGEAGAIMQEVAAGNPVLVMQNLGLGWWPQWHYAVVVGYDRPARELILHTGTREAHRQPLSVFMATWERADRWAVVMLDPREIAATAQAMSWLRSASDLEQTGQPRVAYQAYDSARQQWPDQPAALFGMANSAATLNQPRLAIGHLLEFTRQHPSSAAGWNNLGVLLSRADCPVASAVARGCAAAMEERFSGTRPEAPRKDLSLPACPVLVCPSGE